MGVLTTCSICGHDLDFHGEAGPMPCLEDDCDCDGFCMMATVEKT